MRLSERRRPHSVKGLVSGLLVLGLATPTFPTPTRAATKADYDSAYGAAVGAEADAGKIRNQWTSTQDALKAAKKAAAAGNYDEGQREAVLADEMARRSIQQATEQKDAWRAAVIGANEPAPPAKAPK